VNTEPSLLDVALASVARHEPLTPREEQLLESAVRKLRANSSLTVNERAAVLKRGLELMNLTNTPLPPGEQAAELDDEEAEDLCAALVESEADRREGKTGTPWRELFPAHAAE
jgi:hypothetical protein